jgi:endoglucanase
MLCAHMDEIGFLVTFIEEDGWVRVSPVGGIHAASSVGSFVMSNRAVRGVLVAEDCVKAGELSVDKMYIDLGVKTRREAERRVAIGDFFTCIPEVKRLFGSRIAGRPLDDRVGCAVLLDVAEQLADGNFAGEVAYVFSVQEEVGCRGALPAAYALAPDYALCFDVTGTGDVPGAKPMACRLGDGAAIKIKDRSVICDDGLVCALCALAEAQGIPYQKEILLYGGTDTSSMQLAGGGTRAGALSVPTRYIHSNVETCDLGDVTACARLAVAFVRSEPKA